MTKRWEMMGTWVKYTHVVEKHREPPAAKYYKITHPAAKQPGTGMIIGRRWLQDGNVSRETEVGEYGSVLGEWSEWTANNSLSIPVYVLVKNDRCNPIWIDINGVEVLEDKDERTNESDSG